MKSYFKRLEVKPEGDGVPRTWHLLHTPEVPVRLVDVVVIEGKAKIDFVQIGNIIVPRWGEVPVCPPGVNVHITLEALEPGPFAVMLEGRELPE